MLSSRVLSGLLLVSLLLASGCKSTTDPTDEGLTEDQIFKRAVQGIQAVEDRHLVLKISGDIEVSFDGTHKMQFFSRPFGKAEKALDRPGMDALAQASVATVSTRTPFVYAQGRGVVVGISIVGNYTGDGSYTISKRNISQLTPGPATSSTNLSIVRLELFDMNADIPTSIDRIDTDEKPCKVTIKNNAKQGTLSCPLITDEPGTRKVKVSMKWGPPT